jgi:tRNA (cytidine/uridine-2'-O-)-methyltransferase
MLHIALWEPEIPPNTGNIARLCAATGTRLHLIGKLGYELSDKQLKRAGLDYWPLVDLHVHETWEAFLELIGTARLWLIDNPAPRTIYDITFADGDVLLFGKESTGLPEWLKEQHATRMIDVPIRPNTVRSLNLSTTAGIVLYEALRQLGDV